MDGSSLNLSFPAPGRNQPAAARYHNQVLIGLDIIYEAALAGSPGAVEVLRDLAARLTDRAARWHRANEERKN